MKADPWLVFLICSAGQLLAQDYCSLTVRVLSPDGRRPAVSISVEEKNGRVAERDQESADVQFCDLGGLPVTVKVGNDDCNQVVVKEVPVSWNEPYMLTVTYDPEPCLRDLPPPPVPICRVIFRVSDLTGRWVQGTPINILSPVTTELSTDRYGRASFVTKLGDHLRGSAGSATDQVNFTFTCKRDEPIHEERLKLAQH